MASWQRRCLLTLTSTIPQSQPSLPSPPPSSTQVRPHPPLRPQQSLLMVDSVAVLIFDSLLHEFYERMNEVSTCLVYLCDDNTSAGVVQPQHDHVSCDTGLYFGWREGCDGSNFPHCRPQSPQLRSEFSPPPLLIGDPKTCLLSSLRLPQSLGIGHQLITLLLSGMCVHREGGREGGSLG